MFISFWVIVVLVGVLWYRNTRYAIKQYLSNRNFVLFVLYMSLLIGLGFLLVHVTTRLLTIAQASQEILSN
jgi:hypothetical protein